ncbi:hypothetical protein BH20GEM2_BH20GEM2_16900 [soil metagenome]
MLAIVLGSASPLQAQIASGPSKVIEPGGIFVGDELERYLRVLQVAGVSEPYPWSIRGFSPAEIEALAPAASEHPWGDRYRFVGGSAATQVRWVRPRLTTSYNSGFPFGGDDGAVWAGRGVTTAFQAGFSARAGPLSVTLAPIAFWTQNADFDLMPNGQDDRLAFADGQFPTVIDQPQRFGDGSYSRIDPGQSTIRLDLPIVVVGVATANQFWGPATTYPLILGDNAPGYPHAFLGTSEPVNIGIGRMHGRFVWGELTQSDYSPVQAGETRRFASGLVGVFTPRGLPGLELGGSRFFHTPWPGRGLEFGDLILPLEGLFKVDRGDRGDEEDNQLASIFARWELPRGGFEAYGEYAREDHNFDSRDLVLEPDHDSGYMLGVAKVWQRPKSRFWVFRGEVLNTRVSHLAQVRIQSPFYIHVNGLQQGHTQRGQVLGSPAAVGGSGATASVDLYHPRGRWALAWNRVLRQEREVLAGSGAEGVDVVHSLGAEGVFFRGRYDLTAGVTGAYELNRDFGGDAFNLNLRLGARVAL